MISTNLFSIFFSRKIIRYNLHQSCILFATTRVIRHLQTVHTKWSMDTISVLQVSYACPISYRYYGHHILTNFFLFLENSATCRDTYELPDFLSVKKGEDESRALCTSEYSDISPLRDGNVAFSSLEGRPSAIQFEHSLELQVNRRLFDPILFYILALQLFFQNWVTATDIKITLDRLNTFGDEVFGDAQVLKSYFYAIADVAVGARCKCNGHASKCVTSTGNFFCLADMIIDMR